VPDWLNPVVVLDACCNPRNELPPGDVFLHLAAWAGVGGVCLAVAAARLLPAYLRQQEWRPSRLQWLFRPRVGDDPIRWREQHVIGLAPLPLLRGVPRWMGMVSVFACSAILAGTAYNAIAPGIVRSIRQGRWRTAQLYAEWSLGEPVGSEVSVMGIILAVLGAVVVGVRCATSVAEEKRRKTWEDLVLTFLSMDEIMRGKLWGVLRATVPYLAAYAVPMCALAFVGGTAGLATAVCLLAATGVALYIAGCVSISFAAEADVDLRRPTRPGGPLPPIRLDPAAPTQSLRQCLDGTPPPAALVLWQRGTEEYVHATADLSALPPTLAPQGARVYVFDGGGALVDWTADDWADDLFRQRWYDGTWVRSLTAAEAAEWLRPCEEVT
jgi:hypothetical protein